MANFWHSLTRPILALAPMEGYTDSALRRLSKTSGADVVYTEFIAAEAIVHHAKKAFEKMSFDPSEQPVICQIFGKDVTSFKGAAQKIQSLGFAGIDVNLGCPAQKVVRRGAGVALMRDPLFARTLIESIADTVTIPLSIKIRASIRKERARINPLSDERHTAVDLVTELQGLPISAIMVHGRSFESGFTGDPDTEMIRDVKAIFKGIVLANGGIRTPEDAKRMLDETGADGIGIARGALGAPWIFSQCRNFFNNTPVISPSIQDVVSTMLAHAQLLFNAKGSWGIVELRKHLPTYLKGFPGASAFRSKLVRVESYEDVQRITGQVIERLSADR